MNVLITYDLRSGNPAPHKLLLTEAMGEGLLYVWRGAKYVNRLPNTTIWGVFQDLNAANVAFVHAVARTSQRVGYKVIVEKRATTTMSAINVASDQRKLPERRWIGSTAFDTSRLHQLNDPFFA